MHLFFNLITALLFLNVYQRYVTPEIIKAGFRKCGLVPFDPDAPDYTMVEAAASQREHVSTISEGVDLGGFKEVSCQTIPPFTVNRGCQTTTDTSVTTREEREHMYKMKGSLCDLVMHYKGYAHVLQQYSSMPFTATSPPKEFQKDQLEHLNEGSSQTSTTPFPQRSKDTPSTVSPAMITHKFFPERQPGKGPKVIRNVMDRVFSISSLKMINEFEKIKEAREKKESSKKTPNSMGRKGSVTQKIQVIKKKYLKTKN